MKYLVFILSAMKIQVKVNLEITTVFFYLRFPYCPNFFWFGVVKSHMNQITNSNFKSILVINMESIWCQCIAITDLKIVKLIIKLKTRKCKKNEKRKMKKKQQQHAKSSELQSKLCFLFYNYLAFTVFLLTLLFSPYSHFGSSLVIPNTAKKTKAWREGENKSEKKIHKKKQNTHVRLMLNIKENSTSYKETPKVH